MGIQDIPKNFFFPGGNKLLIDGHPGQSVLPEDRLSILSPETFEKIVLQWAHYYLKKNGVYESVHLLAGAGDKGRDIIGYKDPVNATPRHWDLYQCKHYDHKLRPSDIWLELGKLCYYSFNKDFPTRPDQFRFVSPKGYGPTLQDLFANPNEMREQLIKNWADKCQNSITKNTNIPLEGKLKVFVEGFDFSIVGGLEPTELLEQYEKTPYYPVIFGGSLKTRSADLTVPAEVDDPKETRYVAQLYKVYTEKLQKAIKHHSELNAIPWLKKHFDKCRKYFYKAESLRIFARDSYPEHAPFDDLVEQVKDGIQPALDSAHADSLAKVNATCLAATQIQLNANVLVPHTEPGDRIGICHHLANDDQLTWVEES